MLGSAWLVLKFLRQAQSSEPGLSGREGRAVLRTWRRASSWGMPTPVWEAPQLAAYASLSSQETWRYSFEIKISHSTHSKWQVVASWDSCHGLLVVGT